MHFQREQRTAWHHYLSKKRTLEWRQRHFKQFLDEQIEASIRQKTSDAEKTAELGPPDPA